MLAKSIKVTIQDKEYVIGPLAFGPLQRAWRHLTAMNKVESDPNLDSLGKHMMRIRCALGVYQEALAKQAKINADSLAEEISYEEAEHLLTRVFEIFEISGLKRGEDPLAVSAKANAEEHPTNLMETSAQ